MGEGTQTCQVAPTGDQLSVHPDYQEPRDRKARRRSRKRKKVEPLPALGEELATTISHFFPSLKRWIATLLDTRQQNKVEYKKEFCIWSALSMFFLGLGSRRQFDHEAEADAGTAERIFLHNVNRLAHTHATELAHGDTIHDYLAGLPPQYLEIFLPRMAQRLMRMRVLDYARMSGRYLLAIDGTGTGSSHQQCCNACLRQIKDGKTLYYHLALEAKLITPDGLAFSVASEFVENVHPEANKQDCEQAAMPRIMAKIKERFPRMRFCVLLDGVYANKTIFGLCKKYGWDWIITFKSGRLPTAFSEFMVLKDLSPDNVVETHIDGRYQRLSWVNDLEHEGFQFSAFDCLTYNDEQDVVYFAWVTNLPVRGDTVVLFANHGGRKRWTIENQGFKNQKKQSYALEHRYSNNQNARKNYYFLIQVAHAIVQLLIRGRLAQPFKTIIRSVKNLFRRLVDSFHHQIISPHAADPQLLPQMQIRLDSS
jgi:hypothetical protein